MMAPIPLVMFADLACPFACVTAFRLRKLREAYRGETRTVGGKVSAHSSSFTPVCDCFVIALSLTRWIACYDRYISYNDMVEKQVLSSDQARSDQARKESTLCVSAVVVETRTMILGIVAILR